MAKVWSGSRQKWGAFVVGLFGTIAVPYIVGTMIDALAGPPEGRTRRVKARADVMAIHEALMLYKNDHGSFPTVEQGIAALVPDELDKAPVDPWNHNYSYTLVGERPFVASYGSDGRPGGEGAAADITTETIERGRPAQQKWVMPDMAGTGLVLASVLAVPLVAYRATGRAVWAVGALAGTTGVFAALPIALGVTILIQSGSRWWLPLGIGLLFLTCMVGVLLRIRYSDTAAMGAMALLLAGLWVLSVMIVQ